MSSELKKTNPVKVPRSDGTTTQGFLQGRNKSIVYVVWEDSGRVVGKDVPINQFVELNPEYRHFLPVIGSNVITFEFSPEQIEAFQNCLDCPECFK
jgi:hypothetical protein